MNLNTTIQKILAGDREEFRQIIREYMFSVRSYLAFRIYDSSMVDDLAQEVFMAAFEQLDRYDIEKPFKGWLLGIAANKLKMHFRSARTRKSAYEKWLVLLDDSNDQVEAEEPDLFENNRLKNCLEKLTDRMKQYINWRYTEGKKVNEIAEIENIDEDAVSALLYRSRKKLSDCLGYA